MPVTDLAGVCTDPGICDTTPIGNGRNWVTKVDGLPLYIRAIAQAQLRAGRTESQAIRLAVGIVRRWAHGEGHVTAATRARARAALAEWDRKKAQAHSTHLAQETPHMNAVDLSAGSVAARIMPDRAAVIRFAKKVETWPEPRRTAMKKQIAVRARALGMKPDGDGDYDYDVPAKPGPDMANTPAGVDLAFINAATRARLASAGKAMPGGRFPIADRNHLAKAIRAVGRAKGDHAAVRRFIHRRAVALDAVDMLPKGWKPDGTLKLRSKITGRGK